MLVVAENKEPQVPRILKVVRLLLAKEDPVVLYPHQVGVHTAALTGAFTKTEQPHKIRRKTTQ